MVDQIQTEHQAETGNAGQHEAECVKGNAFLRRFLRISRQASHSAAMPSGTFRIKIQCHEA